MKINFVSGAVISAYLLACGSLYLWGFWLNFDLNILQFIDTTDILKATLIPVIGAVVLFLGQALLNQYSAPTNEQTKRFMSAGGVFKAYILFQYGIFIVIVVIGVSTIIHSFITGDKPIKYRSVAVVVSFVVFWLLMSKTNFLYELNKSRGVAIIFISFLPTVFFYNGVVDGKKIISGVDTYLVDTNINCSGEKNHKFRYIANLSNKLFSLSLADNSLCIQSYEYLRLIKEDFKPAPETKK
ncbi:TPA: hypothetical protein ACX1S2_001594 [Yersinia enterocolitica]|uniref:hypothetical protein n=1 Tax=Yersinia ruckeri TaxID=29486 RepID=UPI0008FE09FC|nr:hypothetical protein [Yersinia ruckeri]HDL7690454.1 hypothetical protein [Yersinia enterocolitica]OJB90191.1 hypothetical protein A9Q60_02570 [Yersinia ruckeri]HDL7794147.1 hypothetical protein [Yersinia enterocolitica]HDL7815101.1 hypothetical protein [Yersinia enterocolitica]HDL7819443.1 hypothetical protein [Yersinia enterocolitica]